MFKVNLMSFMEAPAPSAMAPVLASPGAELLASSCHIRGQGLPGRGRAIAHCPHHSNKVSPRGSASWDTGTFLNNKQQDRHAVTATPVGAPQ